MVNLDYNYKYVLKFLISVVGIIFGIYMFYLIIYESPEIDYFPSLLFSLFSIAVPFYFVFMCAIGNIIPKYFRSMKAVNKYITLNELKKLILNENFVPLYMPSKVENYFKKNELKKLKKDFLVSENFIYFYGIVIPKNMVLSIYGRPIHYNEPFPNLDILTIELVNKKYFEFSFSSVRYKKLLKFLNRGTIIKNLSNNNKEELIKNFKNVSTKEDFLNYIKKEGE